MKPRIPFLSFLWPAALLVAGCASIVGRLDGKIGDGRYKEAVTQGTEWLGDEEARNDAALAARVEQLVAKAAFLEASKTDTVRAYRAFTSTYDDRRRYGGVLDRARLREAHAYYRDVLGPHSTVTDLRAFREGYPGAADIPAARGREVAVALAEATKAGTVEALVQFRKRYDSWKDAAEAIKQARASEVSVAAEDARSQGTVGALRAFRTTYVRWPEAAARLADLRREEVTKAAEAATQRDDARGYEQFLAEYATWQEPEARSATEAIESKATNLAWRAATTAGTWQAYRAFADAHPSAPQLATAETRARDLWGFAGPRGEGELDTTVTQIDDRDPEKISLYVQAIGDDNAAVGGLQASQFEVYENGRPANIVEFSGMESDRQADVVFVFDTTGSMNAQIGGLKLAAIRFAEDLHLRNRDVRLGLVTFGDETRGVYPKAGNLTSSVETFRDWVSAQRADGGGDTPENSLDALLTALSMRFRRDAQVIFVLITDAPAHERDRFSSQTVPSVAARLLARKVTLFSVSPPNVQYQFLAHALGGQLVPIAGHDDDFSDVVLRIADMTAKQYRIVYRSPALSPAADAHVPALAGSGAKRSVRVRARRDNALVRVNRVPSKDVTSVLVVPSDAARMVIATRDAGLFLSTDGGRTWSRVGASLPDSHFEAVVACGETLVALAGSGRLYTSADGGQTWSVAEGSPAGLVYLLQDPNDPDHLLATDGRAFFSSSDAAKTWDKTADLYSGKTPLALSVDPEDGRAVWLFGPGGDARATRDGGVRWETMAVDSPTPGTDLFSLRVYRHREWKRLAFAVSADGRLLRSANGGKQWTVVYAPASGGGLPADARELLFDGGSSHRLVLLTSRGMLASLDNGVTWFAVSHDEADAGGATGAIGPDGRVVLAGRNSGGVYQVSPITDRAFVSGNVYFASNSARIDARLHGYLDRLAVELRKRGGDWVRIEGHTDDLGADEPNERLSLERAEAIRSYLGTRGVQRSRILAVGYGKTRPLFPNTSEHNRTRNRRVEITLIDALPTQVAESTPAADDPY